MTSHITPPANASSSPKTSPLDRADWLRCLDEINEYLDTIEQVVLQLSGSGVEAQNLEAPLRATHTIKGLGAIVECQQLGIIAHRLEDYLKILKARQSFVPIHSELQTWLLQVVDRMRHLSDLCRDHQGVSTTWITDEVEPLFAQIHDCLGDLSPQDEAVLLTQQAAQHSDTDVTAMLFASEVEGLLYRLETVLADPALPCLREELDLIAQELIDLGQMLNLEAFEALCRSIHQRLAAANETEVEAIAQQAVQDWRHTQALIALGQTDNLPRELGVPALEHEPQAEIVLEDRVLEDRVPEDIILSDQKLTDLQSVVFGTEAELATTSHAPDTHDARQQPATAEEKTVRIPVKLLMSLNDLFGELILQRNTLNTQLLKLDKLVDNTDQQTSTLKQITSSLQKLASQDLIQPATPAAPPPSPKGAAESDTLETANSDFAKNLSLLTQTPQNGGYASLFDPLELDRYGSVSLMAQEQEEAVANLTDTVGHFNHKLREIKAASSDLERTAKALQVKITRATMRPFSEAVKPFPRMVRDLSARYGKPVDFKIQGKTTLVDRHVLDALSNPLMHLLRNAFDHGIESAEQRLAAGKPPKGTIEISATQQGNKTLISIQDDGAGIDVEKIRNRALQVGLPVEFLSTATDDDLIDLIFEPGFSTAEHVNSLSGRGIGMDVVRTDLLKIRGNIKVKTRLGKGTCFTLSMPFMLSTLRAMLIEVGGIRLGFPTDSIKEVIRLKSQTIHRHPPQDGPQQDRPQQESLEWEGENIPILRLDQWLTFNCSSHVIYQDDQPVIDEPIVLLVHHENGVQGLYIDKFWGEKEIVIRQVEEVISLPAGFIGCTILGDGHAIPLADTPKLIDWVIEQQQQSHQLNQESPNPSNLQASGDSPKTSAQETSAQNGANTILVIDDSINIRRFIANTLERGGYRVEEAKDGQEAVEKLLEGLWVQAVLCDIEMPRLDGYGFLSKIKTYPKFEALPVIMLTSRAGDKHRQLAESLGAVGYFTKPYDDTALLETLKQLIQKPSIS